MPIYGYRCSQCDHELEVFQSMSDAPLKTCPACGGTLRKLFYPVGVQFKGSGFYTTDYRNGGGSKSESATGTESGGEKAGKPAEKSGEKAASTSSDASASKSD